MQTQRTLGFKSLPRTQLTDSFNSTGIMTKVSSANWFRIHSGIEDNKVGALPRDTQSSSDSISSGRKVAVRSDKKESLASTRNAEMSVLSALNDWKSPGARSVYIDVVLYFHMLKTFNFMPSVSLFLHSY